MRNFALLIMATLVQSFGAMADITDCPAGASDEVCIEELRKRLNSLSAENEARKQILEGIAEEEAIAQREEFIAAIRARTDYFEFVSARNAALAESWQHNLALLEFQRYAADKLLWVVIAICLAGVLYSGVELRRSAKIPDKLGQRGGQKDGDQGNGETDAQSTEGVSAIPNDIVISPTKIQVTSAATGITVLVVSVAFLYLFLREVYDIQVTDLDATEHSEVSNEP